MATPFEMLEILDDLSDGEFKKFKWLLQQAEVLDGFPAIPRSQLDNSDRMDTVTEIKETYNKSATEVISKVLRLIKKNDLVQRLSNLNASSKETLTDCHRKLKFTLRKKFQQLEHDPKSGKQILINEIYTDLEITKEKSEEDRMRAYDLEQTISIEDFFELIPGRALRTLTKGVSGVGKTTLTQKFVLDWAEDRLNNDIHFIFPFTFRELNLLKEREYSWMELLRHFFVDTKEAGHCSFDKVPVLFILDGLNECILPLDFSNDEILTDVTQSASVDVLLTNLIMGNLFPTARIWITTTPEAASLIPSQYIHNVTEVRGFTDQKKQEYIRKRFRNRELTSRIISHIKASPSLQVICHIPIFCRITASVLEEMLKTNERRKLPKTLTELFIHFLLVQARLANVQHHGRAETDPLWNTEASKVILSLGKLAFEHLMEGNLTFCEVDLLQSGTDARAASMYSGIFTQIIKENGGLNQDKLFYFAHLSFQEFLAALHVMVSFISSGVNLLSEEHSPSKQPVFEDQSAVKNLLQSAVDKSLQSPNGYLNLFLHFLIGLSLQSNQAVLQDLIKLSERSLQSTEEIAQYIKNKIRENPSPEQCINLFHCLNDLNDHSLVEEIQQYLSKASLSSKKLSPSQRSALVFILVSSESDLDMFDLKKFTGSGRELLQLLPLVQVSRVSLLSGCELFPGCYGALASVLSSPSTKLTELDLSNNDFTPAIADALKNPHCKLEKLRLHNCRLWNLSTQALSSVLSCQSSNLKELDLSFSGLGYSEVQKLSVGLASPQCRLETLSLAGCKLTWESSDAIAVFLSSQSSSIRQLDLSLNNLRDSAVFVFSPGMESPHCKLETLRCETLVTSYRAMLRQRILFFLPRMSFCNLSEKTCEVLASVFTTQTSSCSLRVLDLSNNDLLDSGVSILSQVLESPRCNLESLRLSDCKLSERSCESLASALSSETSSLKELDLSNNDLQDSGVKLLSSGLKSTHCILETLGLSGCLVTEEGCSFLASAVSSNPTHLKELDLSYNHPGDYGVMLLSAGLQNPQWRLDTLKLDHGGMQRLRSGLLKYACELTLDPNTANRMLILSEDKKQVTCMREEQFYPYHPERFTCSSHGQLLCENGLTGRCYWEFEAKAYICAAAVTYRGINRKVGHDESMFGGNDKSWALCCSSGSYSVLHNNREVTISNPIKHSDRVAVYLNWPAGTLSFYSVCSDTLTHLHTIYTKFTEPVYPGFGFPLNLTSTCTLCIISSASLGQIDEQTVSQT